MNATLLIAPLALATAASAAAQTRGQASAWPVGLVLESGPGQEAIAMKAPFDQDTAPGEWSPNGGDNGLPSASPTAAGQLLHGVGIDALSTGNALVPNVSAGAPTLTASWLAVTVSVSNGTGGVGSTLFDEPHGPGSSGGSELVGYYFDESVGIADQYVDQVFLESSRTHLGLGAATDDDVQAFDYGIGVLTSSFRTVAGRLFQNSNVIFFSVSPAWVAGHGGAAFATDSAGATVSADAAAIYSVVWDSGQWTGPFLWASRHDLGLDTSAGNDVDALDIDLNSNVVVYSAALGSSYLGAAHVAGVSQLMVVDLENSPGEVTEHSGGRATGTLAAPLQVTAANGTPTKVTTKLGIGDDGGVDPTELDALCTIDPESHRRYTDVGIVRDVPAGQQLFGPQMGISMVAEDQAAGGRLLRVQAEGWAGATPQLSLAVLLRRTAQSGPWAIVDRKVRTAGQDVVPFVVDVGALPASPVLHEYTVRMIGSNRTTIAQSLIADIEH